MAAYKHILVPTDGSKLSLSAAKEAAVLAKSLKAKITAVYVIPPWSPPVGAESTLLYAHAYDEKAYHKATEANAMKALDKVEQAAAAEKVGCDKHWVVSVRAWEGIIKAAKSRKCDLIVMASHGRRGLKRLLLGSETQHVLTHGNIPVLVLR